MFPVIWERLQRQGALCDLVSIPICSLIVGLYLGSCSFKPGHAKPLQFHSEKTEGGEESLRRGGGESLIPVGLQRERERDLVAYRARGKPPRNADFQPY